MSGYRAATLETVGAQVSRGPRGDTKWDWYAGMDTGDGQVGRLSCAEARQAVLVDRAGGRIPPVGKSNDNSRGQGGRE